jgi:hypothetical protein
MTTQVLPTAKGSPLSVAEGEVNHQIYIPFVNAKSANYTILTSEEGDSFHVDTTSGNITITLPTVASAGNGFAVTVQKESSDANTVIIDGNGAETINEAATYVLDRQHEAVYLVCDGSEWHALYTGGWSPDCSGMMIGQATNNTSATTVTALDTYYPVAGTWTSIQTRGFTQTLTTGLSTVARDGDYMASFDASMISSRSTAVVTFAWLVNGSQQGPRLRRKIGTGSDVGYVGLFTKLVGLSAGDTIQVGVTFLTGEGGVAGDTITVENGSISITECPD